MNPFDTSSHPETNKEFHDLLVANRLDEMRIFLQNPPDGFDINGPVKMDHLTPCLHYAILNLQYDMVHLLLEFGADPNTPDKFGQTALYAAAVDGAHEIIPALFAQGAKIDAPTLKGELPFSAVDVCSKESVAMLLNGGALPDSTSEKQFTKLHNAAIHNHFKPARQLLEAGANPRALTNEGKDPKHFSDTNHPQCETSYVLEEYLALPCLAPDKNYSLQELLAGDAGARLVDNPYNWRHGLPEQLAALAAKGDAIPKETWLEAFGTAENPHSIVSVALAARQGEAVLGLWDAQGASISSQDLFVPGRGGALLEPTPLCEAMAEYGQLPQVFEREHAQHFSPRELQSAYALLPEASRLSVNLHSVMAEAKRSQRAQRVAADRGL